MSFQVGDQVIHWVHGLGEIIEIEEKVLTGHSDKYYVVQTSDLTLWVPLSDAGEHSLRFLTPASEFQELFRILASPGEPLAQDRLARRTQLAELLKDGMLESTCRVIRDLVYHKKNNKFNENDSSVLEQSKRFLINEWSAALSVPTRQAERELMNLLETGTS